MNWYWISCDNDIGRYADSSWGELVNSDGEVITHWAGGTPLGAFDLGTGNDVRIFDELYFQFQSTPKRSLGDCLDYSYGWSLILRDRFMTAIRDGGVTMDPQIIRVPVRVVNKNMHPITSELFYLIWPIRTWDALDVTKSKIRYYESKNVIAEIIEWVIPEDFEPNVDWLAFDGLNADGPRRWLVNDRIRAVIESSRIQNLHLTPLEMP